MPEYEDAQGNPLTPEQAEAAIADGREVYEVVDDVFVDPPVPTVPAAAPAPPAAESTTSRKAPKALLAMAAVVALAIGGGVAYGMHSLGQRNTTEDVKAAIASKSVAVSSVVESKKAEVSESVEQRVGTRITGMTCPADELARAQWDGQGEKPGHQLRKLAETALPAGFVSRKAKADKGEPREMVMLQLSDSRMGVYISTTSVDSQSGKSAWWKVTVGTSGDPAILGEGMGDGTDQDMRGACGTVPGGRYLVVDDDHEDEPTDLALLKPTKSDGVVYAIAGDRLLKLALERVDVTGTGQEGSVSSSAVPSK
ncbi:hypothetical protein [Gordonia sp. 852002-51296_SCH5728562-b]|uniref:hypothetical protein n=1 Tax=Gordonia sp. 852002-51296_SCH5728562-b TaxID=1834101 RepID=UPI0007EB6A9F|nr:hypothetical protein [Gordonia sp. 852002-51296_SCH5728562-b]OBA39001.1 hypothetical protein A5766_04405 [Gordonia sp. 852002-51296_SCH5728562-b]